MSDDSPPRVFDPARSDRLRDPARLERLRVTEVVQRLVTPSARVILDVGAGTGVFAEAFLKAGALEVYGLDHSPVMLAALAEHAPAVKALLAPADAVPLEAGSVDLAFAGLVLHEVPDPQAALVEWRRVARRGVAVLEWPYREGKSGPPLAHRLQPQDVQAWGRQGGLGAAKLLDLGEVVLYEWNLT